MARRIWYENVLQLHCYYNIYIIEKESGLVLIDTGIEGEEEPILQAIADLGKPLLLIALTHAHYDHVGGTKALLAAHPQARVCLGKREVEAVNKEKVYRNEVGIPYDTLVSPLPFTVDFTVAQGDQMHGLHILDTPGHTPGSVSYFHEATGTLFAGDALVNVGKLKVAGQPNPIFPLPTKGTWNKGAALVSCERLLKYPLRCLACGHGRMVMEPLAALEAVLHESI